PVTCGHVLISDCLGTSPTQFLLLSLHDALPISHGCAGRAASPPRAGIEHCARPSATGGSSEFDRCCASYTGVDRSLSTMMRLPRSEEHTSELQSRENLVCRLLLEKK